MSTVGAAVSSLPCHATLTRTVRVNGSVASRPQRGGTGRACVLASSLDATPRVDGAADLQSALRGFDSV